MIAKKYRIVAVFCVIVLLLVSMPSGAAAADGIGVSINGTEVVFTDAQPYMAGNVVMLPLRAVCEALGSNVGWNGKEKMVSIIRGTDTVELKQFSRYVYVNGSAKYMSMPADSKNWRTYVPQDFIETVYGVQALYDSDKGQVSIDFEAFPVYYSDSFSIEYLGNGCKIVTDGEGRRLLLVNSGNQAPDGVSADAEIEIPLQNVMAASSTHVGPLLKLGVLDSVKAVTTSEPSWYIPEVNDAIKDGKIQFVGGEFTGQPDYELVTAINPEVSFVYTGTYGQQPLIEKLGELGLEYAVNNEYIESHYLGRMEWIKFMGAFYNKELEAEKLLNNAIRYINNVRETINGLEKPKVAWGSSYQGTVYVPDADSFIGKCIEIAGGDYLFSDLGVGSTGTTAVTMEEFYAKAKNSDVFIYSSMAAFMPNPSVEGIIEENSLFADIRAVKNGNVWVYAPDWFQTIADTHIIVHDIAAIFHPEAFEDNWVYKLLKLPME